MADDSGSMTNMATLLTRMEANKNKSRNLKDENMEIRERKNNYKHSNYIRNNYPLKTTSILNR